MKYLDFKFIKNQARGRWSEIFTACTAYSSIASTLASRGHVVIDDGKFRLVESEHGSCWWGANYFKTGFDALAALNHVSTRDAFGIVDNYLNNGSTGSNLKTPANKATATLARSESSLKSQNKAVYAALHHSDKAVTQSAKSYFLNRGLSVGETNLLYGTGTYYFQGKPLLFKSKPLVMNRIVGAFEREGHKTGICQIWITKDGYSAKKALKAVSGRELDSKTMLSIYDLDTKKSKLSGSGIRLGKLSPTVHICEGIETGLAVMQLANSSSVVACCTANLLAAYCDLPSDCEKLVIWADQDRSNAGFIAAEKLREVYRHIVDVEIKLPKMTIPANAKGVDWLDYLNAMQSKAG